MHLYPDGMAIVNDHSACVEPQNLNNDQKIMTGNDVDGDQSELESGLPAAVCRKLTAPYRLFLPQVVLYQMCKSMKLEFGTAKIIGALLRTCKAWRSIVQSAVRHLELQSLSQVRTKFLQ